jgi:ribonuclease HI
MEIKKGFVIPPWAQTLGTTTGILPTAEEATRVHDELTQAPGCIHIYTDGSGIDDRVGAAAYCTQTGEIRQAFMGTNHTSTVYAGEVYGLVMALQMVVAADRLCPVYIFSDNQTAVKNVSNPSAKEAQHFLREVHGLLQQTLCPVQIHWIPAHVGIAGNETVDIAAKEATGWRPNGDKGPTALCPATLIAPVLNRVDQHTEKKWTEQWHEGQHGRQAYHICKQPHKKNVQLYYNRPHHLAGRAQSSSK